MKVQDLSPSEYNPYFQGYISKVGEQALLDGLVEGMRITETFFRAIPESKQTFRYDEGKWTAKEILLHIIDSERMFCFRALSFARCENTNLPGFDENEFAANSMANDRSMEDLVEEYSSVRKASIAMFSSFDEETLKRIGQANNSKLSVRAAGFLICGHEIHHRSIISERYL
ncbi:DinB family protein [Aureitalea sp. L0-47]|uniref:DinB family protein n=1 Tax=Aureitalea sp. L0-47 TaxID=2816962 RepID=UPI00223840BA|nr:DinB family protein [Aureitalea sp. L0-47]MCW5519522.1 DinB family protein [Aureitalea sp. L0-47]